MKILHKKVEAQEKIKAQEMHIVQQNRLAQMGEMIAMIAHQWRQPLTVVSSICGSLQLKSLKEKFEKDSFLDKLQKIVDQTQYLSQTIEDFRNFFKPDKSKSNTTSKQLIDDSLKIIEPMLKKYNIEIISTYSCAKELYTYPNELKQVILNIIKNSQDAFLEKSIDNPYIKINAQCDTDSKCTIFIEDNAGGIPDDIMDKIFDPYFSTKSEKNGTGLGLYMSKLIVEDHCNGELSVDCKEGKTIFKIKI
jgi:signal transduction histidine kinase